MKLPRKLLLKLPKLMRLLNVIFFTNANANAIAYAKVYTKPTIWSMQWLNKKLGKITK